MRRTEEGKEAWCPAPARQAPLGRHWGRGRSSRGLQEALLALHPTGMWSLRSSGVGCCLAVELAEDRKGAQALLCHVGHLRLHHPIHPTLHPDHPGFS